MRVFFIAFTFIAVFSVYPKIVSIYSKLNPPAQTKGFLVVVANDKKAYEARNINNSTYTSTPTATSIKPERRQVQNNVESSDIIKLSNSDEVYNAKMSAGNASMMSKTSDNHTSKQLLRYKDGEYSGTAVNAYYGYVQVRAIIRNGKISDIKFLKFPNNNQNSVYLSNQALPYLKKEVIKAQSDKVDVISGATYTSMAFMQSTKMALADSMLRN